MSSAIIQIKKLCVERDRKILRNINWTIHQDQQWVILGANGSGKTSLLNTITGYLVPTSGAIQVFDNEYGQTNWQDIRKKIGLVSASLAQRIQPDETALFVVASGKKAIINLWKSPSRKELNHARKILRQIQCAHLEQCAWNILSQGERQRVLIGRALMANFAILFLDEPCAGLDPVARENFLKFIEKLLHKRQAPYLVFITHHIEEITKHFTHVLLLKNGSVLNQGKKQSMLTSKNLSSCFNKKLNVIHKNGHYQIRL
ncbi:MAG: ABC transporter ATP-binding protein [Verrucomicrobiae bacterium]|nr:ABC transporter ATP-binding protein [Verrucomicrobiae bacterium]